MNAMKQRPGRPSFGERLSIAVIVALIYALLLYGLFWASSGAEDNKAMRFIGGLVLMPIAIASLATSIDDPRGESTRWRQVKLGWLVVGIGLVLTVIFFKESIICVVMGLPLFISGSSLGSLLTLAIIRKFRSPKRATLVILLPFIGLPIEPHLIYPDHNAEVTTVIEIAAPADVVWRNTVEIRNIDPSELQFTFSHGVLGVPQPQDAVLTGEGIHAVRHLKWSKNIRFEEVITGWETNRFLSWDFRFSPDSIPAAIEGHINVDSQYLKLTNGDYHLKPLANGNTQLTLTSRYRIRTPINIYCDWWGSVFFKDFHSVVLDVIKNRSEAAQRASSHLAAG